MAVWEISFNSNIFQHLEVPATHDLKWIDSFAGKPLLTAWKPISVFVSQDSNKVQGDFPSIGGVPPIFNERALRILQPLIQDNIEALPLVCPTEKLYAINIVTVVDCLDKEKSQLKRFSDGRIMRIEQYVLKEGCVEHVHIFKIPEQIKNRHYVSDEFKSIVETTGLKGLIFKQIA